MNCIEIQNLLLTADDPRDAASEPALRDHLASCAACGRVARQLMRLEEIWREAPEPAESAQARDVFLARYEHRPASVAGQAATRLAKHTGFYISIRWAVAAALLMAVGLGSMLAYQATRPDGTAEAVHNLLALNLDLAKAQSADERREILAAHASQLQATVASARFSNGDRELAESLLQNASYLAKQPDPLQDADHFSDIADRLLVKMDSASAQHDAAEVNRLAGYYYEVVDQGVFANLDRSTAKSTAPAAPSDASAPPTEPDKLQKSQDKQARRAERLEQLLQSAPEATQKELRKIIEMHHRHHKRKK